MKNKKFMNKSGFYAAFIIIVMIAMAGRCTTAQAAAAIKMNPGQTKILTAPESYKNVTWSSSKRKIATVNKKGRVTAQAAGTAVITAKSGSRSSRFTIRVERIQLNTAKITLNVGGTKRLQVKNALGKVTWTSDSGAAAVDSKGRVTAVKKGKAVITAKVFGKVYKCNVTVRAKSPVTPENPAAPSDSEEYSIEINVGNKTFSGKIYNNNAGKKLAEKLPMTISMSELNNNEKYYYMPDSLPVDAERVSSIRNGDIMLFGSDCLVLFYKSFSTSYSYTRLGYVEDPSGLEAALGEGSAEVSFHR